MVNENELTPEERDAFKNLQKEKVPPKSLEDQVIRRLKNDKLIISHPSFFENYWRSIAASLIFFIVGYYSSHFFSNENSIGSNNLKYMLILHEDDNFKGASNLSVEYYNWLLEIRKQERFITGEQLDYPVTWIDQNPGSAGKDVVSGFFIVEAKNLQDALQISRSSPHLKYGGRIELREIITH